MNRYAVEILTFVTFAGVSFASINPVMNKIQPGEIYSPMEDIAGLLINSGPETVPEGTLENTGPLTSAGPLENTGPLTSAGPLQQSSPLQSNVPSYGRQLDVVPFILYTDNMGNQGQGWDTWASAPITNPELLAMLKQLLTPNSSIVATPTPIMKVDSPPSTNIASYTPSLGVISIPPRLPPVVYDPSMPQQQSPR